jgi:hypothetical protein
VSGLLQSGAFIAAAWSRRNFNQAQALEAPTAKTAMEDAPTIHQLAAQEGMIIEDLYSKAQRPVPPWFLKNENTLCVKLRIDCAVSTTSYKTSYRCKPLLPKCNQDAQHPRSRTS